MKLFEQIQDILSKGIYQLWIEDQYQLINILAQLYDQLAIYEKNIFTTDQKIDLMKSDITLKLKAQKADGNKNITDLYISAEIDRQSKLLIESRIEDRYILSRIKGKIEVVRNSITLCRDSAKYDPNIDIIQLA